MEVKNVVLTHAIIIPFQKFSSFVWFHLAVTIVFLTGNRTYVVFVARFIKVMWKVTFLELVHTEGLRECFERHLENVQTVDESDG